MGIKRSLRRPNKFPLLLLIFVVITSTATQQTLCLASEESSNHIERGDIESTLDSGTVATEYEDEATTADHPPSHRYDEGRNDDDDEYIDLDEMTDDELEEICVSRGFELVKEVDPATGEPIVYSHKNYVDAAMECLQIESDLEEILQKHPEILEDVRKESERMMKERDKLQYELEQLQKQSDGVTAEREIDSPALMDIDNENSYGSSSNDQTNEAKSISQSANSTSSDTISSDSQCKSIYDFKEIISEVNQQIKSDIKNVVNFIFPEPLRRQIKPAFKTFITIAKETGLLVYDLVKRYVVAFSDNGSKGYKESSGNSTVPEKESMS